MSDFIEVTNKEKFTKAFVNINCISRVMEDTYYSPDKDGRDCYILFQDSSLINCVETYDEVIKKIKNARNSSSFAVCDAIVEDEHSVHPQYAGTALFSNQKEYEERAQNQGYTIV